MFEVLILGSGSATPTLQRSPSAQLLTVNDQIFLIDCGEGTQTKLAYYKVRTHRINQIFISHLHGDHYLGLVGLISTMHLQGRTADLHLYCPPELEQIINLQLQASQTTLRYPLHFHSWKEHLGKIIFETEHLTVQSIPLNHRIPCSGFIFREKQKKRKLIKANLQLFNVPIEACHEIRAGADYITPEGKVISNAELSEDPKLPRSYAYCSDTIYDENLIPYIKEVSMLYHESTFMEDMADRARETYHTTSLQAGKIAKLAEVERLLIGHFSARYYDLKPMLTEALIQFPNTELAEEGVRFAIE